MRSNKGFSTQITNETSNICVALFVQSQRCLVFVHSTAFIATILWKTKRYSLRFADLWSASIPVSGHCVSVDDVVTLSDYWILFGRFYRFLVYEKRKIWNRFAQFRCSVEPNLLLPFVYTSLMWFQSIEISKSHTTFITSHLFFHRRSFSLAGNRFRWFNRRIFIHWS